MPGFDGINGGNGVFGSGGAGGDGAAIHGAMGGHGVNGSSALLGSGGGGGGGGGGHGGNGDVGGGGGSGGPGGPGGGGSGGTIHLKGSVVRADGARVEALGGFGHTGSGDVGGRGWFHFATNAEGGKPAFVDAQEYSIAGPWGGPFIFPGTRDANPFITGPLTRTPYVPDLAGGAEIFGELEGIDAGADEFTMVRDGAPGDALAALLRLDVGPSGYADDFVEYDILLMINLTAGSLTDPVLGIDRA